MGKQNVVRAPPPEQASIFHQVNPKEIFQDLDEIGHGSFGSVYQATKEGQNIAIKIMKIPGGFESDAWGDIYKEIIFMSSIEHEFIIAYYGCYLSDLSVWLTLEYAVGSVMDVMDVFKAPLKEGEISAIIHCCLQALEYLHASGKIHRDIKAGNILLTEDGTVKLADFGSASAKSPANSLIGTPYWMAPELIMAMETGTYGCLIDIWSLGITAIELGERKPPLFELNAMTALYHIPQKEPPTLKEPKNWSLPFSQFVDACLKKDAAQRSSAASLLKHTFMTKPRAKDVLKQLVVRAKSSEVQAENTALLQDVLKRTADHVASVDGGDSAAQDDASKPGPNPEPEAELATPAPTPASVAVPKAEPALAAANPASASAPMAPTQRALNAISEPDGAGEEPASSGSRTLERGALQAARANRWQDEKNNIQSQAVVSQLKEIQKMRQEMIKQMEGINHKQESERAKAHSKSVQELDRNAKDKEKGLERHLTRCKIELEASGKAESTEMKKFVKMRKDVTEKAWAAFKRSNEVEYKRAKETLKVDALGQSKDERKAHKDSIKQQHIAQKKFGKEKLERKLIKEDQVAKIEFDLSRLPLLHAIKFRHLGEEVELILNANDESVAVRGRHMVESHAMVQRHLEEQQTMQRGHLAKLVETENRQALLMVRDAMKTMKKRHLSELKAQPKELKAGEHKIKRMLSDSIRMTEKKYKTTAKTLAETVPKGEQNEALSQHKSQKSLRLTQLEDEYQERLTLMKEGTMTATTKNHMLDLREMEEKNTIESSALKNYQAARENKQNARLKKKQKVATKQEEKDKAEMVALKEKMAINAEAQRKRLTLLQEKQSQELMELQQALSAKRAANA